jgi:hypothetical protein
MEEIKENKETIKRKEKRKILKEYREIKVQINEKKKDERKKNETEYTMKNERERK